MRSMRGVAVVLASGALACSSSLGSAPDAPVAGPYDAGGGRDASRYEAWWSYPECQTADESCPLDICVPASIVVVADRCAPYQQREVGCVTRMTPVASWYCLMHESSSELLFTLYPPKGDGFVACPGMGGGLPTEGSLCRDGAAD